MTSRLPREVLIFRALCVLDDAALACREGPLRPPLPGVRLALAYLYSVSNDRTEIYNSHRGVFDAFWQAVISDEPAYSVYMQNTIRGTEAHACFAGICRRVGVAQTIDFGRALARARGVRDRSGRGAASTTPPEVDPGA